MHTYFCIAKDRSYIACSKQTHSAYKGSCYFLSRSTYIESKHNAMGLLCSVEVQCKLMDWGNDCILLKQVPEGD